MKWVGVINKTDDLFFHESLNKMFDQNKIKKTVQ